MLIDFQRVVGDYLHEVFVAQLDWWVVLGLIAQILFTARFLVQWIESERRNRMVIPIGFWFLSIAGGSLLLIYAIHRRDPVFIIGQSLGVFIYARNLYFELRDRRELAPAKPRSAKRRRGR